MHRNLSSGSKFTKTIPLQHPHPEILLSEIVLLVILKYDLLFFSLSMLAQEIFCKCASKDELSPLCDLDGRAWSYLLVLPPG